MRLIQFIAEDATHRVGAILLDQTPRLVRDAERVRDLVLEAHRRDRTLEDTVEAHGLGQTLDYDALIAAGRIRPPLDHPEPSRCILSLTGLTHLGSAQSRDSMHARLQADDLSDSMKMFKLGVDGGKPGAGTVGAQPEWAYKGDGNWIVAPGAPLPLPAYAEDGGEEGEVAGLYVIGDGGEVLRAGYALANEYSDHVMERQNYLYLAHSKLRPCAFGPELLVGELPPEVEGTVRILRDGEELWSGRLLSGEANMCHSIANLEHHHFKYPGFRRPGDVHVHFYGASALSVADGVHARPGDLFEVESPLFGRPLRNPLAAEVETDAGPVRVTAL